MRLFSWLALSLAVWVADRVTKLYVVASLELGEEVPVLPVFSWIRLHNEGAAFSMLNDAGGWQRWFLVTLAFAFSIYVIVELRRMRADARLEALAFSLILGGATGNLYDRLMDGYVVDFALAHWGNAYFPAFNVADSAISIGAVIWIFTMFREWRERRMVGDPS